MRPAPLVWREGIAAEAGYRAFLRDVFGAVPPQRPTPPRWQASGFHDRDGGCVAALERVGLLLRLGGVTHPVTALRRVGVAEGWRGRGLFRALMERALPRTGACLLYAEELALYGRFGFRGVPQPLFAGPAPPASSAPPARMLDRSADAALILRLLAGRAPVSEATALLDAPGLFLDRLNEDADLRLAHLPEADALIAYEEDGGCLVLADVAAAAMPSLAAILGAMPQRYDKARTLFPPDRLGWRGTQRPDDTGLMLRGPLPAALSRLPPTAEF